MKEDGTVVAWGFDIDGATGAAFNLGPANVSQAGSYTVVVSNPSGSVTSAPPAALTVSPSVSGSVMAWGKNDSGQSTVPGGLNGVVAIAAGLGHSLALVAGTNITPAIVFQVSGNHILLSWPLSVQGFNLQSTTNLTDNNSWTTLTNSPVIVD